MPGATEINSLYKKDERPLSEKYGKMAAAFFIIQISDSTNNLLFSSESDASGNNYDLNGMIVSDVEWDETDCNASMLSLTVQNIDMTLHDSVLFAEGNNIDLWIGYDGYDPEYMGRGIITEIEPEFASDRIPTISIKCYDISYFMMEEGRCEIVPEGTSWAERKAVVVAATQGQNTSGVTQQNISSQRGGDVPENAGASNNSTSQSTPSTETKFELRRTSNPRRRRKSGKVWRELKDSEIVEKIFESYKIVPYVQATDESSRSRTVTRITETTTVTTDEILDTERQALNRPRPNPIGDFGPHVNVDQHGARIPLTETPVLASLETTTNQTQERTGGRKVVQKSGTSDWEFIKKLAKKRGYIVYSFFHIDSMKWIGYWGSIDNSPQQYNYDLMYNDGNNTSLSRIKPRISMRGQSTEIDLSYVDPRLGTLQRVRVAMDNVSSYASEFKNVESGLIREPIGSGPEVTLTIHGQRVKVISNRVFRDAEDAKVWLMSFWLKYASDFCQVEGDTIIGFPEIHAREIHNIGGIGRVSGEYFLSKVTHKLGAGSIYKTTFSGYRVSGINKLSDDGNLLTVDSTELGETPPE